MGALANSLYGLHENAGGDKQADLDFSSIQQMFSQKND